MWTDPGWFIDQLEVRICFWSSATWPSTSCTWTFPLHILVLYGDLIPLSFLNQISPPVSLKPPSNGFEINNPPPGKLNNFSENSRKKPRQSVLSWVSVLVKAAANIEADVHLHIIVQHDTNFFWRVQGSNWKGTILCAIWINNLPAKSWIFRI